MVHGRRQSLKRLLLSHEIALLLLVMVTGLLTGAATYFWQQTSAESVRINNMTYITEQLRGELFRQIQEAIRARIMEDPRAVKLYGEYSRQIGRGFNQLRRNSINHKEDLAVQQLQKSYSEIQLDMNQITRDPYAIGYAQRMKILDLQFSQRMVARFETSYREFKALLADEQEALEKTRDRWIRLAPVFIPAIIIIAVVLVIFTRRTLHREFVRPVATVKEGASVMSRGNLRHRIPEQGVTEIAEIAASVNTMAADLAASRDALVQSEKQAALGLLVPVVAHNIRNPLASIRATAQMLEHCTDQEDLRESGEAIIQTMDRLERWVNALVSYLHPLKPSFRQVRAGTLFEAVQAILRSKLQEKHISVERVNWQEDRELKVDPDLMEQALSGLLANAIDASPPHSRVQVEFAREPGHFLMRIRDSGHGIPFMPEAGNLEPGPSTKRFGTGLGIPVAFKICQSHGWELKFSTPEGGGTEVLITAPVTDHAQEAGHEQ